MVCYFSILNVQDVIFLSHVMKAACYINSICICLTQGLPSLGSQLRPTLKWRAKAMYVSCLDCVLPNHLSSLSFFCFMHTFFCLIFEETTVYESVMWLSHLWSCLRYWSYFILLHLGTLWPINAMVILHIKHTREKLFKVDWCMIQSMLFIVLGVVELGYIVNRAGWNASLFVPS